MARLLPTSLGIVLTVALFTIFSIFHSEKISDGIRSISFRGVNSHLFAENPGTEVRDDSPCSLAAKSNTTCAYRVIAFNSTGLSPSKHSNECITSGTDLLSLLKSLAEPTVNDSHETDLLSILKSIAEPTVNNSHEIATIAIGASPCDTSALTVAKIDALALIVDEFLAPRLDWRIVGERFEEFGVGNADNSTDERTVVPGQQLFYNPMIHAPGDGGTFFDPAIKARQAMLNNGISGNSLRGDNDNDGDNESLLVGVDMILVRVFDENIAAFASALRRHQFPDDCSSEEALERDGGRTFIRYGSAGDFLGALTWNNRIQMGNAINSGAPYVWVQPPGWARTYRFDDCSASSVAAVDEDIGIVNGVDCGFLPISGGACLHSRVDPALKCLSEIDLGALQMIVLPKDGIPSNVCKKGHKQLPPQPGILEHHEYGPPKAITNWCPQCSFGGERRSNAAEIVLDPKIPMSFEEMDGIIIGERRNPCPMELPPLKCSNGRTCCFNEIKIKQNVLDGEIDAPYQQLWPSVASVYLTRFNRASRRRIARLHQPRVEALHAQNVGWKEALATGMCATLHIRRGDNIQRCQEEGPDSDFCTMDRTLKDYMEKAVPMLAKIGGAKHVFVMTDDPDEVADDKLKPWIKKGYFLEVVSGHNQYSQETYSDWDPFIESLYAAQACKAFVGHHISSVSQLVYHKMCMQWGECPISDTFLNNGTQPGVNW